MMAKTPAGDWDHDEREALTGFERDVEAMRARHARDPEIELLRAAEAEVLPDDLQSAAAGYLAADRWSRALVDGFNDPSISLDRADQSRLLDRIRRDVSVSKRQRASWWWLMPSFAASAAGIVAVLSVIDSGVPSAPSQATNQPVATETPRPAPVYVLALEKPEVKLSAAALTWRGGSSTGDLLADLKPGLDAFRRDDYAGAQKALAGLTEKYPLSVEVLFYLGVSQLYLGETREALGNFIKAVPLADASFAADVMWYGAVAEERLGNNDAARTALTNLCRGTSARGPAACAAAAAIK